MTLNKTSKVVFIAFITGTILLLGNCTQSKQEEKKIEQKSTINTHPKYIGDESCISCHSDQHQEWAGSHHDWAMKEPDDSTVLGNFNNHSEKIDGVAYKFGRSKNLFTVDITEKGEDPKSYIIWKTFGFYPLQQYLVQTEKGQIQTLRVTWDSKNNKWYHQYKDQIIAPKDWLHWTNGGQRWNTMCADCHSTDLKKKYNVEQDHFATTYKTINVGCEACHGPGSEHLNWTKAKNEGSNGIFKPTGQTEILNLCAPCHSRRSKLKETTFPWEDFHDHYLVQNLSPDFYELDGQIKEEDYVFGSFLSSKMYHEGVKCTDCHNPHSMKLKAEGNNLCLSCHEQTYDNEKHHKHKINTVGAECVNCHMTGKKFMGHDFRRDHSFRIPRPDQSVQFGTSNACNGCHDKKSAQWAANKIVEWYGPNRVKHFSDFLAVSADPVISSQTEKELVSFVSNKAYPEIARSSVVENLQNKISREALTELLQSIDQNEHLILNSAISYFTQESPQTRLYFARQFIFHNRPIIRMNATKLLLDIPVEQFNENEQNQIRENDRELLLSLRYNADFPIGRLQLGDYYTRKNNPEEAIKHYRMAIKMDSLIIPVYSNLATALNLTNQNGEALKILKIGINKTENNSQLLYLKGLLEYEMGNKEEAIKSLNHSINNNPNLIKAYYNLAIMYFEAQNIEKTKSILLNGLEVQPNDQRLKEFLTQLEQ